MDNSEQTTNEMQAISDMLDTALEYGLEVEVIYQSLRYMKENSKATPVEAFALGVAEWVR